MPSVLDLDGLFDETPGPRSMAAPRGGVLRFRAICMALSCSPSGPWLWTTAPPINNVAILEACGGVDQLRYREGCRCHPFRVARAIEKNQIGLLVRPRSRSRRDSNTLGHLPPAPGSSRRRARLRYAPRDTGAGSSRYRTLSVLIAVPLGSPVPLMMMNGRSQLPHHDALAEHNSRPPTHPKPTTAIPPLPATDRAPHGDL